MRAAVIIRQLALLCGALALSKGLGPVLDAHMRAEADPLGNIATVQLTHQNGGPRNEFGYLMPEDFSVLEEGAGKGEPVSMDCSACQTKARPFINMTLYNQGNNTGKKAPPSILESGKCCFPAPSDPGPGIDPFCSPIIPKSFRIAIGAPMKAWQWNIRSGYQCTSSHMGVKKGSLCDPCRPLNYRAHPFSSDLYCRSGPNSDGTLECFPKTKTTQLLICNPVPKNDWYGGWDPYPTPLYDGGPPGCDKR